MPRAGTLEDYQQRVERVRSHIAHNLDQPWSLDELAGIAAFSRCHFHRVFRAVTGEGVAEHQRRLRLERAARRLRTSDRQVVDIALEAGYDAHESFTRAFASAFGVSPSRFRSEMGLQTASMSARQVAPLPGAIERVGPLRVVRIRHSGSYDAIGPLFQRLGMWGGSRGLFSYATVGIGFYYDDPEVTEAARLRSEAAYPVDRVVANEGEIEYAEIPARSYFKGTHRGPYSGLREFYVGLMRGLLENGRREPADEPCVEFYLNVPGLVPEKDLLTEVCLPLED